MTKKQKNALLRIIVVFVLMLALMIGEKTGILAFAEEFPAGLFIYLVPYGIIAWDILWKAARNIRRGQVFDENFLMTLATIGAFGVGEYSEAVAVMLFYQIGELFESYAVNRSRKSISDLMDICPEYANMEENGELRQVDPDDVAVDDIIVVKTGERIPLDGIVVEGESMVDTSALTGESVPRRVTVGSEIISGCVNGSGLLRIRVTKEFEDSTVAKILELVENASSKKAKVENFITRFAKYYTPVVVLSAVALAFLPPLIFGEELLKWIARACTFLVISCPCALVISVPLSFFGGIGAASRLGVLVKGSNFLEALSQMDTIVFDKTGTLTKGEFRVTELHSAEVGVAGDGVSANITSENGASGKTTEAGYAGNTTDARLLEYAAYAESYSNHPIAASIREAYESGSGKKLDASLVKDAEEISGHGVKVLFGDQTILAGNEKLMQQFGVNYEPCDAIGTVVYVAAGKSGENLSAGGAGSGGNAGSQNSVAGGDQKNSQNTLRFCGSIVIADSIKEDAPEAIRTLKSSGIRRTVMLTGDRKTVGEAVARKLGLDEVHTELLPADKVAKVEELLRREPDKKRLAFVGDGINDAPVLTRADIGIAMGSLGSDAAIEAADVVLMDDDTRKISKVVQIARKTMGIVKQNIVFALGVKFLVLILGAFGYANMWAAVFADVGVSVIAILNAMRTLRVK